MPSSVYQQPRQSLVVVVVMPPPRGLSRGQTVRSVELPSPRGLSRCPTVRIFVMASARWPRPMRRSPHVVTHELRIPGCTASAGVAASKMRYATEAPPGGAACMALPQGFQGNRLRLASS